jgi:hypothetical protein
MGCFSEFMAGASVEQVGVSALKLLGYLLSCWRTMTPSQRLHDWRVVSRGYGDGCRSVRTAAGSTVQLKTCCLSDGSALNGFRGENTLIQNKMLRMICLGVNKKYVSWNGTNAER